MKVDIWSAVVWRFVRAQLPGPSARVAELGCGPDGGLVPALQREGYQATGIDPEAPAGPGYCRVEFERYQPPSPVHAVVACTSLHHVADLGQVLDRVAAVLVPGGSVVVVEWAWERFDEPTARWCFARLGAASDPPGWLARRRKNGLPPACPGTATGGAGRNTNTATPARRYCANWMPGSTGGSASAAPTSSTTWPARPTRPSRAPSTPG